jgi:hypothetical protein
LSEWLGGATCGQSWLGTCCGDTSQWNVRMLAFIYVFSICVVATMLFVAANGIEPNRRLKFLIVVVSVAATAGRLMP